MVYQIYFNQFFYILFRLLRPPPPPFFSPLPYFSPPQISLLWKHQVREHFLGDLLWAYAPVKKTLGFSVPKVFVNHLGGSSQDTMACFLNTCLFASLLSRCSIIVSRILQNDVIKWLLYLLGFLIQNFAPSFLFFFLSKICHDIVKMTYVGLNEINIFYLLGEIFMLFFL